jgi:endonuclease/exonuclease/phosphatase family metal-dependent hydrolase
MDLSNEGGYRAIAWLLAIGVSLLLPGVVRQGPPVTSEEPEEAQPGWFKMALIGSGIISVFTMLYFAFMSPTVISRWTRHDGLLIQVLAGLALVMFAWLFATGRRNVAEMSPKSALLLMALFGLGLTLTLASNQVGLPKDATAYPLFERELNSLWIIPLVGMLLLFPLLFLGFGLLVGEVMRIRPSLRRLGFGFGLASLFMLLMILGNVFTSVWAYVDPILEPVSRNRFWHIHSLVALVLTLSLLAVKEKMLVRAMLVSGQYPGRTYAFLVSVVTIAAVTVALLLSPRPATPVPSSRLSVAGYNLYQGYDPAGQRSHQSQCNLLKEIDADIIGLSETDTARIAGGNFDIVRYLAECLEMHAYDGPRSGAGTFGYALLSSYPIVNAETIHLFSGPGFPSVRDPERNSSGDQVALIRAQVRVGDQTFHIFVNHFDSQPPRPQPQGFAQLAAGLQNVIAIGDYNCEPGRECFAIISAVLEHCADSGDNLAVASGKIDHIFVSPDLHCSEYSYVDNDASDHPVVTAEIEW